MTTSVYQVRAEPADQSTRSVFSYALSYLWTFRSTLTILLAPVFFVLIFAITGPTQQAKCLYTVLLMATYWITEVLPLPVTALLPLVIYPLLGVVKAPAVAKAFMSDALFLFIGGYFIAIALEHSRLHKRVALKTLLIVGADPRKILLALMSVTAFLSMWISNAAATGMMLPIIQAILVEMIKGTRGVQPSKRGGVSPSTVGGAESAVELESVRPTAAAPNGSDKSPPSDPRSAESDQWPASGKVSLMSVKMTRGAGESSRKPAPPGDAHSHGDEPVHLSPERLNDEERNLCKMMLLSACYASSIGGVGTLTGTPPNIIVFGFVDKTFGKGTGLSYLTWMLYAVPIVILNTIFAWLLLAMFFLGIRKFFKSIPQQGNVREVILRQYATLGTMSFQESSVAVVFSVLILLWIFHSPQFIKGWADFFPPKYVSGATPAIFMACLLFALPVAPPDFSCDRSSGKMPQVQGPLMKWKYLQSKFPWDMIILIGGSFAMAEGISESGLSNDIGNYLSHMGSLSPWILCTVAVLIASAATEFTSNAAMATILTPILFAVALNLKTNPLYLALSAGVAVSYAFMLPIGTPANAIVFALGLITVMDMVKVGFLLNIVTALVTILASNTWGWWIFGFGSFPDWAGGGNGTTLAGAGNETTS